MEILAIIFTLLVIGWLLSNLKRQPSGAHAAVDDTEHDDETVVPFWDDLEEAPPVPPNFTPDELITLGDVVEPQPIVSKILQLPSSWSAIEVDEFSPEVEEALGVFLAAGLFPDHQDKRELSDLIRTRTRDMDRFWRRSLWHDALRWPSEMRHPWLDHFMLLQFGPEAGFALHNAFRDGLTTEALSSFARDCRDLSERDLDLEAVAWGVVSEDRCRLGTVDSAIFYDANEPTLWQVPLCLVSMLNAQLGNGEKRFEVFSMLPLYGETMVFYLTPDEKRLLVQARGWEFFAWNQLEGEME